MEVLFPLPSPKGEGDGVLTIIVLCKKHHRPLRETVMGIGPTGETVMEIG